jgi:hypothetical protein
MSVACAASQEISPNRTRLFLSIKPGVAGAVDHAPAAQNHIEGSLRERATAHQQRYQSGGNHGSNLES